MEMEVKIEVASVLSNIEQYIPVLKEYDFKEKNIYNLLDSFTWYLWFSGKA